MARILEHDSKALFKKFGVSVPEGSVALTVYEAKEVAETEGGKVLEAVGKEAANDAKSKLEAAGATVEVV